jgi:ketosteroid isomerase-like protein
MQDWQIVASVEIRELYGRYFFLVDNNDAQSVGDLFAEDGVLISEVMNWECAGRAAITDYIDGLRSSWSDIRIHIAQPDIDVVDEETATSVCYFTVFNTIGIDHWGIYRDEFVRANGKWLFSKRSIALGGSSANSRAGATQDSWRDGSKR